jgi:Ser/Thr protein kinase RdoA (MazF antagonist)
MRTATDLIAENYRLGDGPWTIAPVTRGALGQIWKLSAPGSSWAVKEMLFGCEEEDIQGEAALRDAAAKLGVSAPRLMRNRDGFYVSRVDGSHMKLYDWVDGSEADASDPELQTWCGHTLALLHTAGAGASEMPVSWYEQCPEEADWAVLDEKVRRAGLPWADELGRFITTRAPALSRYVTPSSPDHLVTSHRDIQPQNVLVGPAGPTLLDWDNAGPVAADRELAHALYFWAGGNDFSADAARRLARGYVDAGGPASVRSLDSFSLLFATDLNFVHVQAEAAIDPSVTDEQRAFASRKVVDTLTRLPDPAAMSRLTEAVAGEW